MGEHSTIKDIGAPGDGPDFRKAADRRDAARFALLIRPAKIVCDEREFPCVMRDVSERGVSIRTFHPLPEQGEYAIEMLSGARFAIAPIWQDGLAAGFRFVEPVELAHILANAGPHPNRPVRLAVEFPALLEHGGRKVEAMVSNLSQQGARLVVPEYLALGQLVALQADCLPRLHAKVRWRKQDEYGVVFEQTFKLAELSSLAVRIYASPHFAITRKVSAA